jgi:hypothetical protein
VEIFYQKSKISSLKKIIHQYTSYVISHLKINILIKLIYSIVFYRLLADHKSVETYFLIGGFIMAVEEKEELEKKVDELYNERINLEKEINELNLLKIEKLKSINEELGKKSEWMDKERIKAIKERDNLLRKVRLSNDKNWKSALKMITILGVLDLVVVPIIITLLGIPLQWIFVSMGLVTFLGIMLIVNYMSGTSPFNTGEIRKAITVSLITVYLAFVPLMAFGLVVFPGGNSAQTIVTNFTWIIGAVIVLYFSTRPIEEYIKKMSQ